MAKNKTKLKYQEKVNELNCKLPNFNEKEVEAYRWVFDDINNQKNFKPVKINTPKRIFTDGTPCTAYALSLYNTLENAKAKFLNLSKDNKNFYKKVGNNIANGTVLKTDGICNTPNKEGHFDLFEYENVYLHDKFIICHVKIV